MEVWFHNGDNQFHIKDKVAVSAEVFISIPEQDGDLALLVLPPETIPGDILPLQLLDTPFQDPPRFIAYGFPKAASDHGRFAEGGNQVGDLIQSNYTLPLLQLREAEEVRRGFSGGPLVHADLGYALGMISDLEAPDDDSNASIPYAIPARFIAE